MKFNIFHQYDIDGGFGDAIPQEDLLGYIEVDSEEDAKAYCDKWSVDHVYDIPYNELHEGKLIYKACDDKPLDLDKSPIPNITLNIDIENYYNYIYDYFSKNTDKKIIINDILTTISKDVFVAELVFYDNDEVFVSGTLYGKFQKFSLDEFSTESIEIIYNKIKNVIQSTWPLCGCKK